MSILTRISTLTSVDLEAIARADENAEKTVEEYIVQLRAELAEARAAAAAAMAEETRLRARHGHSREEASDWHHRAEVALRNREDDRARAALLRKIRAEKIAANYQARCSAQHDLVHDFREALAKLEARISEAESIREIVIARSRRARSGGGGPESAGQGTRDATYKVEGQADAHEGHGEMDRIAEIEDLERVERELADLKREFGNS